MMGSAGGPLRRLLTVGVCAAAVCVGAALLASTLASPVPDPASRELAPLDTTAGLARYEADCAACHGYSGEGLVGAHPPLAGAVPELLGVEGGRRYLVGVLLHGLSGRIDVAGRTYDGLMPAFGHLSDRDLAELLNHLATAWGNRDLLPVGEREFTALEIALVRAYPLSQVQLNSAREALSQALAQ